jgi:hypothetical protein
MEIFSLFIYFLFIYFIECLLLCRYCPNMIVIDTPGMIHPPKGRQLTAQQRALAQASREAEALVLAKIKCEDYIILCVEDTTDWKHATTRNVVMQADPQLLRTVLVTTKLDTKIPQFSEADDLEDFLQAPLVHSLFSQIMGGPFFTSVPSGRVGPSKEFETNEAFVEAVKETERSDRALSVAKLGTARARPALRNVGVSQLRTFLEGRIEESYRRNVAKIVPLLQSELRSAESKLAEVDADLKALSLDQLRYMANDYREKFSKELSNAIQGNQPTSLPFLLNKLFLCHLGVYIVIYTALLLFCLHCSRTHTSSTHPRSHPHRFFVNPFAQAR